MRRWIVPLLGLGCLAGLFVACYGRAIFHGEQFAFRDAGHYYYPLHQRVQAEWDAGRWPLWEPEENGGMPLLGNPTAAVLYPGKLVFALVSYPLAARLYIMGHTLLAFAAMLALLRQWGTSAAGATLGALGYAFGGPILFQYCNVIFLVGAAWVPLGFRALDGWLRLGRRSALAELAVVLAMETLGGDPEAAYLTGVCAAGYAAMLARIRSRPTGAEPGEDAARSGRRRGLRILVAGALLVVVWFAATFAAARWGPSALAASPSNSTSPGKPPTPSAPPWASWVGPSIAVAWALGGLWLLARWRRLKRDGERPTLVPMLLGLIAAAALAAALSAAQLLPVLEFILQSGRAAEDGPHSIYPFSLLPFRLVEFIWPNIFGGLFQGNASWLEALPPHDVDILEVWVPTLYVGGLSLVLALGGASVRFKDGAAPWRAWMTAVAVLGLVASFGQFGSPIWLTRLSRSAVQFLGSSLAIGGSWVSARPSPRDGDGSLYWLLATALPGFGQFRYPSKLLTFNVLGIAALAGQGWDALIAGEPRARRRMAAAAGLLLAITIAVLALAVARREAFQGWLDARKLVSAFGPLDARAAVAQAQAGLAQGALILAAALGLVLGPSRRRPLLSAVLALSAATVDLGLANARMVLTVPQSILDATPEAVAVIRRAEAEAPRPGPFRVHRMAIWGPTAWTKTASPDRPSEFIAWERRTAQAKHGINAPISYTASLGVTQLYDYDWFFGVFPFRARPRAAQVLGVEPGTVLAVYPRRAFDMWNTRYFILPYVPQWGTTGRGIASFIEHTERIFPAVGVFETAGGKERVSAWLMNVDYQVRRNLDEFPRAWVVHDARTLPAFRVLGRSGRNAPMQEMLFSNDMSWPDPTRVVYDPRRYVWLEEPTRAELAPYLPGGEPSRGESVRVVRYDPDRVELEAVLERPGVVVLADVYYPGWGLTIDGRPAPIRRANRMMRGAAVAAGRHVLVYTYRPLSFRIGLGISGLGLAALVLLVLRPRPWRRYSPPGAAAVALSS